MKHFAILFLAVFFGMSGEAQVKSAKALMTTTKGGVFAGTLKEGYHFNDKAPNEVLIAGKSLVPAKLEPRRIEFKMPAGTEPAQASLYVCDDAKTYCETHEIAVRGETNPTKARATQPKSKKKAPAKASVVHGFIQDDLARAMAEARRRRVPVLIDFAAHWCPACVRLETELFPTKEFAKAAKGFVKVRLDVDRFENTAIAERYGVKGIPTLIAIDANGDEIERMMDFQPHERMAIFLQEVAADPTSVEKLRAKADKDSASRLKLGRRLLAAGKPAESLEFLRSLQPVPPETATAEVRAAVEEVEKDPTRKSAAIETLRKTIAAEPSSTRSLAWRAELVRLLQPDKTAVKTVVEEGKALADRLLKGTLPMNEAVRHDAVGEFSGFERFYVAILKADLIDASAPSPDVVATAWSDAADVGLSEPITPDRTGPALRQLLLLIAAKRDAEAEKRVDAMLAADPGSFELKRRKLKILVNQGKFKEAAKLADQLLGQGIGRNDFWVTELAVKAHLGLGQKEHARRLLSDALARPEVAEKNVKTTKAELERLLKDADAH